MTSQQLHSSMPHGLVARTNDAQHFVLAKEIYPGDSGSAFQNVFLETSPAARPPRPAAIKPPCPSSKISSKRHREAQAGAQGAGKGAGKGSGKGEERAQGEAGNG